MLSDVPVEYREAVEHGGWIPIRERIYQLDPERHRYDGPVDRGQPCDVGYDPGDQACAVVGQQIGDKYVVVDEIITGGANTEELLTRVRQRGWTNIRTVVIDPQASMDTDTVVYQSAPGAHAHREPKRSTGWYVHEGIERVQWALQAADGRTRLQFAGRLWDHGHPDRGVVKSMISYRYTGTGRPVKDNSKDHQCDAVRMLVVAMVKREAERPNYATAHWDSG
jgi:hypothetical protein